MYRSVWWRLCLLVLLASIALVLPTSAARGQPTPTPAAATPQVVRVYAPDGTAARRLIDAGYDVLEMRDGSDLFVLVAPPDLQRLVQAGWQVTPDAALSATLRRGTAAFAAQPLPDVTQSDTTGYRRLSDIEDTVQYLATTYPDLVRRVDIGDSWEQQSGASTGSDLWMLHMGNTRNGVPLADRPLFFLMAAIHAREIVTPEVALRFAGHLAQHYNDDPTITWLLDEYQVAIVPMVNPDGYRLAEQGYWQRKNTNTTHGGACNLPPDSFNQYGVDLNRNFSSIAWGTWDSPDLSPCWLTYPGPTPASEPETRAIQQIVRELAGATRPRPASGQPAPPDTTGVLITMHSFSDLVLWAWGHTQAPAPNAAGLRQLGERMAGFNGYTAAQSISLYPTSGTTDDWAYGELGLASYTFEIGPQSGECGGFFPPFACLDGGSGGNFWARNLPALLYAARVSRAPYRQPAGPDTRVVGISLQPHADTTTVTLALDSGNDPTAAAELYVGLSPERGGVPVPLAPLGTPAANAGTTGTTGTTGTVSYWQATLATATLQTDCTSDALTCQRTPDAATPALLIRGQSPTGVWGPVQAVWATSTTERDFLPTVSAGRGD